MARRNHVPTYRRHKQSGQAVVTLTDSATGERKDRLLGRFNTAESRSEYGRVIAEWEARGRRLETPALTDRTVAEVLDQFLIYAKGYYRDPETGLPSKEYDEFERTGVPLTDTYPHLLAADFGPAQLKVVRDRMVTLGWCRNTINQRVRRIRHVWKWAAEDGLVPASTWHGLCVVRGLQAGRTAAKETEGRKPVANEVVDATLPHLPRHIRGLVLFQRLAPGGPLSAALGRYQVDPPAAARLVARLARAVHFAHQRGILHRDLKPSNILLDGDHGLVGDFGLVRDLADPDPLTGTAELVGTPAYMAPEQTAGKAVTVATDVYGLGAVLYACLTGRPPFAGLGPMDILVQVRTDDPVPPARLNARVARDLDAVCRKCLDKDPARRYASAADLADDLGRFLRRVPVRAKPIGPVRRTGRWVVRHPLPSALATAAALAFLTAAGLGAWGWQRHTLARADRAELLAVQDAEARQRFFAGLERVRKRRGDLYAPWAGQSLADLRELAALPPARDNLADLRTEAAAALAAGDLEPGPLLADFPAYAAHFSADGKYLAVAGWEAGARGRVELTDRETGARRDLTFPADAAWVAQASRPDGARSVRFSPDRKWLVVGTRSGWLARWDLRKPDSAPLAWPAHTVDDPDPRFRAAKTVGFTADGQTVLSGSRGAVRGWAVTDGRATGLELKGSRLPLDFYPVADEMAVYSSGQPTGYGILRIGPGDFVPDRRLGGEPDSCLGPDPWLMAYRPDERTGVCVRFVHPSARPRPLQGWEDWSEPTHLAFSPAGDRLAAVYEHDQRVRVWDVAGGTLLAARTTDRDATHAVFAPDGRHLIVSGRHGARAYVLPGGALETVAVVAEPEVAAVAATADHAAVLCVALGMGVQVYRDTLPLGRPAARLPATAPPLTKYHARSCDVTPDGRGFALTGSADGTNQVVEYHSGARLPAPDVSEVRFGPDGRLWVLEDHLVRAGSVAHGAPVVWRNDPTSRSTGATLKCVAPGPGFTLVGRRDGRVFRLDRAGAEVAAWDVMPSAVLGLAISPNESRAVAGGERGEVRLVDLASGAATAVADAHRAAVHSVAFGPTFFATGSADRRVRLWTLAGELIATFETAGPVQRVLVSGDGSSLLVHIRGERAVRRWRLDVLFREWAELGLDSGLSHP